MEKRKIIKIDENKCNGCRECIPNCLEGALQIIDGKARMVSDLFCDGLGACIGHCPQGAISTEEREAQSYDERKVIENVIKQGDNVIKAHLEHLKSHNQHEYLKQAVSLLKEKNIKLPSGFDFEKSESLPCGCPGSMVKDFRSQTKQTPDAPKYILSQTSQLRQWPVQIKLVPSIAPYLNNADLLIAADCVPFAYADFHQDLLKGKTVLVGCPKLDDINTYKNKIFQIIKNNNLKSVTYAHMEVSCCFSFIKLIQNAIAESGKNTPFKEVTISIKGERLK